MPKTTHNCDPEFRRNAVNLLLSSGRPLKRVAEEPGITANSLRTWRDRAAGGGRGAEAASAEPEGRSEAPATGGGAAAEIRRLQKEVEYPGAPARDPEKSHGHTVGGPAERYALIDAMRDKFAITELCDALDVSRSGYHAARGRTPGRREAASRKLIERMKAIHAHRHTRSCGSPRMARELKGGGHGMFRKEGGQTDESPGPQAPGRAGPSARRPPVRITRPARPPT